jgi:outer membrane protein, heavy metal efflux system
MRRIRILATVVAALCIPATGWAADNDDLGDPLKLEAVIAYARQHNPQIRAAQARATAAEARPSQAGALPDPMVDLAYHDESFNRLQLGSTEFAFVKLGASQELPFPGKLGLKREIATHGAEQVRAEAHRVEADVVGRIKVAYAEYAHLQEQLALLQRNRDLLQKLARDAEARYAVGEGIQQDVLKAHVELSLLVDRETTLDQRRQSESAEINALLNRAPWEVLGAAEHPVLRSLTRSLQAVTEAAHHRAPDLEMEDRRVAGGESAVRLARREYLPDFVVRADYMYKSALEPEWEVGVGIKLPLYYAAKQRAGVNEAAADLAAAEAERDGMRRSLDYRIKDLYLRAQASERLIALYQTTVVPQARLALESATGAYGVGKVDFLTLLNSFTVMLEYEMRYHEELANFQKAMAELEAVSGTSLEDARDTPRGSHEH